MNCELLALAKEMWVARLSHVGTLESHRWIGFKCLLFSRRTALSNSPLSKGQTSTEGIEGKAQIGIPITNRRKTLFPICCGTSPPDRGISFCQVNQQIRPFPDAMVFLSHHLEQAHVTVPETIPTERL